MIQTTAPTNQVFKWFLHLTGLNRQPELVQEIIRLGAAEEGRIFTPSLSQISGWRRDIDSPRASRMPAHALRYFINGLFIARDSHVGQQVKVFQVSSDMLPLDENPER